jgi:hypothetical protein
VFWYFAFTWVIHWQQTGREAPIKSLLNPSLKIAFQFPASLVPGSYPLIRLTWKLNGIGKEPEVTEWKLEGIF